MNNDKIILTGDRPTGRLHVGHYVGSLKRRVILQNSGEYKKTFIGKMKYFFKSTKINKKIVNDTQSARRKRRSEEGNEPIVSQAVNTAPLQTSLKDKKFYTIEDLVTIYAMLEKGKQPINN